MFNTLHALYNVEIGGVEQRNRDVLNYLRQFRYGSTHTTNSLLWNFLVLPNFLYNNKVDSNLAAQASAFTNAHTIDIYGSEIGMPHLSITTLCYDLGAIKEVIIPSFWTGWGGDLSTLLGQVIYYSSTLNNTSATFKNDIYNYAYNLVGGNNSISSFGLSNVYEDIDAIYFANHISEKPIDLLVKEYYKDLKRNRKQIFIDSVLKSGKSLFESVYEEYTGYNGLKRPYFKEISLIRFIKVGIKSGNDISNEKVDELYKNTYLGEIYTLTIRAFVDKINSINEQGFLN